MLFLKNLTKCDRIASTAAKRVQNAAIVVRKTMAHRLWVAFRRIKIHTYNCILHTAHYWIDDKIQPSLIAKI